MQRQCRLEFGYAGTPPCAKLVVKKFTGAQQLKQAIVLLDKCYDALADGNLKKDVNCFIIETTARV